MRPVKRRYILLIAVAILVIGVIVAGIGILMFTGLPLVDGTELSAGQVTVASYWWGPIKMGAYLFKLKDGGYGLIDSTQDSQADAIRTALSRVNATPNDIRAIFLTHWHNDHSQGALAFPNAEVYVLEPDTDAVRRQGITISRGLTDGEIVDVLGTPVEVFAIPGHTAGSAAYLVNGVLFLGDTASGIDESVLAHNAYVTEDALQSESSLRSLAQRLRNRRGEVKHIAFGHHGPVKGLEPLLNWADGHQ
jgi:hydroxyacylglutathione hydrolase